jgi:transcriptional regulator with XRE-family HTH domain
MQSSITQAVTLRSVGKSGSLSDEQNERVRKIAGRLFREKFGENGSEMARELGIRQPTVSRFLSGIAGTSLEVAGRICELAGEDPFTVLGLRRLGGGSSSQVGPRAPMFRTLPGWLDAEVEARRRYRSVPDYG